METKLEEINDIKEQRQFLIGKVILGQRIALDRCHHSYKIAQEKAFNKLWHYCVCDWRRKTNLKQ